MTVAFVDEPAVSAEIAAQTVALTNDTDGFLDFLAAYLIPTYDGGARPDPVGDEGRLSVADCTQLIASLEVHAWMSDAPNRRTEFELYDQLLRTRRREMALSKCLVLLDKPEEFIKTVVWPLACRARLPGLLPPVEDPSGTGWWDDPGVGRRELANAWSFRHRQLPGVVDRLRQSDVSSTARAAANYLETLAAVAATAGRGVWILSAPTLFIVPEKAGDGRDQAHCWSVLVIPTPEVDSSVLGLNRDSLLPARAAAKELMGVDPLSEETPLSWSLTVGDFPGGSSLAESPIGKAEGRSVGTTVAAILVACATGSTLRPGIVASAALARGDKPGLVGVNCVPAKLEALVQHAGATRRHDLVVAESDEGRFKRALRRVGGRGAVRIRPVPTLGWALRHLLCPAYTRQTDLAKRELASATTRAGYQAMAKQARALAKSVLADLEHADPARVLHWPPDDANPDLPWHEAFITALAERAQSRPLPLAVAVADWDQLDPTLRKPGADLAAAVVAQMPLDQTPFQRAALRGLLRADLREGRALLVVRGWIDLRTDRPIMANRGLASRFTGACQHTLFLH